MLNRLSQATASFFMHQNLISEKEVPTYAYCFEIFFSIASFWLSILILAYLTKSLIPAILYYCAFYCFRTTIGGYHASTHLRCYFLSIVTFGLFLWISRLPISQHLFVIIGLAVSVIIIYCLAPIEHANKPFSPQEFVKFRKRSILLLLITVPFTLLLLQMNFVATAFYISYGIMQAAISLLAAYMINKI